MRGIATPIVVYVHDPGQPGDVERGGHVLGEACNAIFDPYEHGLFGGSAAS